MIDAQAHGARSRKIGAECAVLLKNEGQVLPLDARAYASIVIIGQAEYVDQACNGGGGSSKVTPLYTVAPVEGMQDILRELGSPASVAKFTVAKDLSNLAAAREAAGQADLVILMAGSVASEGADLPSPNLPNHQNQMLDDLLTINPSTVLVLKDSSPVLMPWISKAKAVLEAWNQALRTAMSSPICSLALSIRPAKSRPLMLLAKMTCSTRAIRNATPVPMRAKASRSSVTPKASTWATAGSNPRAEKPLFPFGFGLSYTTFELSGFSVTLSNGRHDAHHRENHGQKHRPSRRSRSRSGLPGHPRRRTAAQAPGRI
ncbi:MAG: glycoside hydrolase family 3 C-terminal domain-containing protein [Clostridiales bacterium]|nr:glycoside hydrolase family 3 C-terminal domain-containing protein [Clostridiales bacterium]